MMGSALQERYRQVVASGVPASRVLVLCGTRAAADRLATAVLGDGMGFDHLPVTTVYGLAHDLLARSPRPLRLAATGERRVEVARLLAGDDAAAWPVLGEYLGRAGFAAEVAAAVDAAADAGLAVADGAGGPWPEVAGFARRLRARLGATGRIDPPGLLDAAAALAPACRTRFDHVLVAPAVRAPSAARFLDALGVAWEEVEPGPPAAGPPRRLLVSCDHPSVEAEAIAAELVRRHRAGVAWADMAVLVRHLGRRARSVGRALARHGVPVVPVAALATGEPVVRAVLDLLRWVGGDDGAVPRLIVSPLAALDPDQVRQVRRDALAPGWSPDADRRLAHLVALRDGLRARAAAGDTPADLAYEAWARGLTPPDGVDDRALDALVAFVDGLAAHAERNPSAPLGDALAAVDEGALVPAPWRASAPVMPAEGVTVITIGAAAADGAEWNTVVIAGCVEGELPRARGPSPLFDVSALGLEPPSLAGERRLFAAAADRATAELVATAAPAPGVLLSRFVEAWPAQPARLLDAPGVAPVERPVTAGAAPVTPDRRLTLSASQLDTYDDCPLRYAYQYVLRAREEPGVHAGLGVLAHEVLAEFCDPERPDPAPRSLDGLLSVADAHWREDVARFRPQVEEVRRDLVAMLTGWWEREFGGAGTGPPVLATERRFDIGVGPHRLVGSIDRVDRAPGGGLAVIDYKTSKREPPPDEVVDDIQLAVYHLAATRDPDLAALGEPTALELHYLRSMHTFRQPITDDHAERTEARVLGVAERILAEDFEPSVDASCRTCPFHRLCPLQPQGRRT